MSPSAEPPVKSLRIKRVSLCDFRAFPGPSLHSFDLDGRNMLIYGENGSGKSSVFHALRDFFSLDPSQEIENCRNVFSATPPEACKVEVTFDDGGPPAVWHQETSSGSSMRGDLHPTQLRGRSDQRVVQAALRRACLDYRALLDTNYLHGDEEINLFNIVVRHLVHDFPIASTGGEVMTVEQLWRAVEGAKPKKHSNFGLERVNNACAAFNSGLNHALAALHPYVCTLLSELVGEELSISPFIFPGVSYKPKYFKRDRQFHDKEIRLGVDFRKRPVHRPQLFLNEARLSALALAIYLAGRMACTPSAPGSALKLLILDDVLIGLDMANRIPVLDILRRHFADWQIILLTYDRTWFELVHMQTRDGTWQHVEMYRGHDLEAGFDRPIIRQIDEGWKHLLSRARKHLGEHDHRAAAVYARAAFESWARKYCEDKRVKVPYSADPRGIKSETLWQGIKTRLIEKNQLPVHQQRIDNLESYRRVVLNPYSHAQPVQIEREEIERAINAVQALEEIKDT